MRMLCVQPEVIAERAHIEVFSSFALGDLEDEDDDSDLEAEDGGGTGDQVCWAFRD